MASLFRGKPAKPEFVVPPAEIHAQSTEDRIEELNAQALQAWREGRVDRMNRLLDMRNAIRPPRVTQLADVPYIPGRTS